MPIAIVEWPFSSQDMYIPTNSTKFSFSPEHEHTIASGSTSSAVPNISSVSEVPLNDRINLEKGTEADYPEYELLVTGVPDKWRADKQFQLCLQLVRWNSTILVDKYSEISFPEILMGRPGRNRTDRESVNKPSLKAEMSVICASHPGIKNAVRCFSCVQRERRMQERANQRRMVKVDIEPYSIEEEQRRILLIFYRQSSIPFFEGECIVPVRLTCYSRHCNERKGFCIFITLRDSNTNVVVAQTITKPVLIIDDHKKAKIQPDASISEFSRASKRPRRSSDVPSGVSSDKDLDGENFDANPVDVTVKKVTPARGPISGGIEIALIGSSFFPGCVGVFGLVPAQTEFWTSSTLLCTLPPSTEPQTVPVTLFAPTDSSSAGKSSQEFDGNLVPVGQSEETFTYESDNDSKLMEVALQIIGLKLTGQLEDARVIAQNILSEVDNQTEVTGTSTQSVNSQNQETLTLLGCILNRVDSPELEEYLHNCESKSESGEGIVDFSEAFAILLHSLGQQESNGYLDLSIQDSITGLSLLHFAALNDSISLASAVLDLHKTTSTDNRYRDLVILRDVNGYSPLHFAAMMDHSNVLSILLPCTMDIRLAPVPMLLYGLSQTDMNLYTPLHLAVLSSSSKCVELLLECEVSIFSELEKSSDNNNERSSLNLCSATELVANSGLPEDAGSEDFHLLLKQHRAQYGFDRVENSNLADESTPLEDNCHNEHVSITVPHAKEVQKHNVTITVEPNAPQSTSPNPIGSEASFDSVIIDSGRRGDGSLMSAFMRHGQANDPTLVSSSVKSKPSLSEESVAPEQPVAVKETDDWNDGEWEQLELNSAKSAPWYKRVSSMKAVAGANTYLGYNVLGVPGRHWIVFFSFLFLICVGAGVTPPKSIELSTGSGRASPAVTLAQSSHSGVQAESDSAPNMSAGAPYAKEVAEEATVNSSSSPIMEQSVEYVYSADQWSGWQFGLLGVWLGFAVLFAAGTTWQLVRAIGWCITPRNKREKSRRGRDWGVGATRINHAGSFPLRAVLWYLALCLIAFGQIAIVFQILIPHIWSM